MLKIVKTKPTIIKVVCGPDKYEEIRRESRKFNITLILLGLSIPVGFGILMLVMWLLGEMP